MKSIKRKEDIFYRLFKEQMAVISELETQYQDMIHNFSEVEMKADAISELEQKCDAKTHAIMAELHTAFITPFDREDIFAMVMKMDDIADTIEVASSSFVLYDIKKLRDGAEEMADNLHQCIEKLTGVFAILSDYKKNPELKTLCIDLHHIESLNDKLYRKCIYHLFHDGEPTLEIIKWNHLYKVMEDIIDVCDHIARMIEGIVMKHA